MKRIYIILIVLMGINVSCTKNFEDYNTDKKHPTEVPGEYTFTNAQKALADQVASTNVNLNVWKLWTQYWTETTYTDESKYNIVDRTIADFTFRTYYRDVLNDLQDATKSITAKTVDGDVANIEKSNKLFIIDLVEVYCYNRLVDIFGNVPYSQALDINNISPAYDDAATIYTDLIDRLNTDLAGLDDSQGSFGVNDIYFGGDVGEWIKFGNTLKVKLGITIVDANESLAKTTIESAYDKGFGAGESCNLPYPGGSMSNPLFQDLVQSGRHDFVVTNTIVDMMNNLIDPRMQAYFSPINFVYSKNEHNQKIDTEIPGTGKLVLIYTDMQGADSLVQVDLPFTALAADSLIPFSYNIGGKYGYSNDWSSFSHIADAIKDPTYAIVLLDNVELDFYLAEAAEHNFSVGGTAEDYYNMGIEASFAQWGLSSAADYLANPEVAYATATGDFKQKIGTQAWLALYVRGLVSYTEWRRLDYPLFNLAPNIDNRDQIPVRFTYPINEQTLNAGNYYDAASAIGGDKLTTKLFWDKF